MKIYNSYIFIIALSLLLTTIILIATGQKSLDTYYTIYIIETFIITELYVYFNTKARRGLAQLSTILFGGFVVVLLLGMLKILT